MSKNNYLFYADFLKKRNIKDKFILIAKTKKSYLIGPLINLDFDEESFYRRIKSNSIYNEKMYKKLLKRKSVLLISKYGNTLKSNQIIEIYRNGEMVTHTILKVPGEYDEKE